MHVISFVSYVALLIIVGGTTAALQKGPNTPAEKEHYNIDDAPALFEKFIKDYDRQYKDEADKQVHYEAFVNSLKKINELNSRPNDPGRYGLNNLADLTKEEFNRMNGLKVPTTEQSLKIGQ